MSVAKETLKTVHDSPITLCSQMYILFWFLLISWLSKVPCVCRHSSSFQIMFSFIWANKSKKVGPWYFSQTVYVTSLFCLLLSQMAESNYQCQQNTHHKTMNKWITKTQCIGVVMFNTNQRFSYWVKGHYAHIAPDRRCDVLCVLKWKSLTWLNRLVKMGKISECMRAKNEALSEHHGGNANNPKMTSRLLLFFLFRKHSRMQ